MKLKNILNEVTIPMDVTSPFDDMISSDQEDSMQSIKDERHTDREKIPKTSRKNSNFNKAKRVRNMVQMLKRERSTVAKAPEHAIDNGETPDQSRDNSHGSAFLYR